MRAPVFRCVVSVPFLICAISIASCASGIEPNNSTGSPAGRETSAAQPPCVGEVAGGCWMSSGMFEQCTEWVGKPADEAKKVCEIGKHEFVPGGCPRDKEGFLGCCEHTGGLPGAPPMRHALRTCDYNHSSGTIDARKVCEENPILGTGVFCE